MDVQRIKEYLTGINIPCQISKGAGLCEIDSVQVVICFLIGMLNPDDDVAWMSIAHDILNHPVSEKKPGQRIRDQVACHPHVVAWEKAMNRGHALEELMQLVWGLPLECSSSDETAIQTFLSEFQTQCVDRYSMLEWLTDCIENPKAMGTENKAQADAVHIMTLHAAKGLEFDVVMVPFMDAQFNVGATDPMILSRQSGMGLSIPGHSKDNVIRKAIFNDEKQRSILEEIRLFYVTLTRAKAHILLTGKRLKRKNTSRLSLCLPYLEDKGGTCKFNFPYTPQSSGQVLNKQGQELSEEPHLLVTYSPPVLSQPKTWSVSNILDAMACPKQMILKKVRSLDMVESEAQKEGLQMHEKLAQAMVQARPSMDDPEWLQRIKASDWFQRVISTGRLSIESPFEYQVRDHVIRGRFDAVWFCDVNMTFQVFEFKRSIGDQMERYQQQVNFYANVIEEMNPNHTFDANGSLIVNMKTSELYPVKKINDHIRDGVSQLDVDAYGTNETACNKCPYNDHIDHCSQSPMMAPS